MSARSKPRAAAWGGNLVAWGYAFLILAPLALWFGVLGYGARWLAPWFARPRAWQILDSLTGVIMAALAVLLLPHAFQGL